MAVDPEDLAREGVPIALIVLVWAVVGAIVDIQVDSREALGLAGLLMAGLYVLVRGVALAEEARPAYDDRTPAGILRENGRALLAAAPWFLAGIVLAVASSVRLWPGFPPRPISSAMDSLAVLLVQAGVGVVGVFVVARGTAALRAERERPPASTAATGTDDEPGPAAGE